RMALLMCVALLAPVWGSAGAAVLHGSKGFTAHAPRGFHLSQHHGLYRISGHRLALLYARVPAAGARPADVGAQLVRTLGRKPTGVRTSGSRGRATVGSRVLEVRTRGRNIQVASLSGSAGAAREAVGKSGLALLQRIADSVRGGQLAQLPRPIPMKLFTAPDGGSSALVPDLPGWAYNGGSGIIEGTGPQGGFVFGFPFYAAEPNSPGTSSFVTAPFPSSAEVGLQTVVPLELRRLNLAFTNVAVRSRFDGSQSLLGPHWRSDFMSATFSGTNGAPGQGVFLYGAGLFDTGVNGTYANYLSYALVRRGTDPRIGAALLRAWGTWNPTANQQQRLHDTINTILTTNVAGGAIDPQVFDEAAAKWDAYFRGPQG
ncbi:MAG: hypothetical protein M3065_20945, partial [Actinomycetota bacterium]|nr:hypothetical protein [Actinomycetota bacterium]